MLKKITWTEGDVYSLKLRDDLFTLVQMRRNSIMQFFDVSSAVDEWDGIDLNGERSLFYQFVADKPLKCLFSSKLDSHAATPSQEPIPTRMLSAVFGNAGVHGANLIELTDDFSSDGAEIIKSNLSIEKDIDLIYRHELNGMLGDPVKLKRRLLRYFETGVNWDETKEFLFKGIEPPAALRRDEVRP